ncbi:uncharacterized protein LOC111085302 [Limulus polyphemus]|uniref:Uncharacterized protein LOC111085302 n=1 Tax=Limulus polyphemus TaxID=6850 RepID=A0ABM1S5N6_LIMPO|nr:uncharacterized protein LOC111085302 [Limulus polyphemus]
MSFEEEIEVSHQHDLLKDEKWTYQQKPVFVMERSSSLLLLWGLKAPPLDGQSGSIIKNYHQSQVGTRMLTDDCIKSVLNMYCNISIKHTAATAHQSLGSSQWKRVVEVSRPKLHQKWRSGGIRRCGAFQI